MAASRWANRKDRNHKEIENALKAAGWVVIDTTLMRGRMPDMLASKDLCTIVVEAKMPKEDLTPSESKFFEVWKGHKIIAYSGQDAVNKCFDILIKSGGVALQERA